LGDIAVPLFFCAALIRTIADCTGQADSLNGDGGDGRRGYDPLTAASWRNNESTALIS
jgi:hypothetical protein